ncbi:MAG: hypothetical protein ACRD1H_09635, partial [Vicinamibacterales bacterium]
VNSVTFLGSSDADTLTVDHSGGLVGGGAGLDGGIDFQADALIGAGGGDTLVITGDPGIAIARETYLVGMTEDAGTWILDPNDNMGAGAAGMADGDEMLVTFTGLEPADSDTAAAVFDLIMNAAGNRATIENGGMLNGANALQVTDDNATFETTRFANKTTVRVMGNSRADEFRIDYSIAAAGLTTLEIYGHVAPGVVGQPADDDARDTFVLRQTVAATLSLLGDGGSDLFHNGGFGGFGGTFELAGVNGTVNISGGTGDDDTLALTNSSGTAAVTATLTNTQLTGAAPATINYNAIDTFFYGQTGTFDDLLDVLSTNATTNYIIHGFGGSDIFTIGNQTSDFNASVPDGSLDAILGDITIVPDSNVAGNND